MKIIGVTGGSGSGKSSFCAALAALGVPTLDTDAVARDVVKKGTECLSLLVREFGERILAPDGSLCRHAMAYLAFTDARALEKLNEITHRFVKLETKKWTDAKRAEGCAAVTLDVPLLFQSGMDAGCELTVAVVAPESVRVSRVIARDGISEAAARRRIAAQKTDAELSALADVTVENDGLSDIGKTARDFFHAYLEE